jgi:hypothetical protein
LPTAVFELGATSSASARIDQAPHYSCCRNRQAGDNLAGRGVNALLAVDLGERLDGKTTEQTPEATDIGKALWNLFLFLLAQVLSSIGPSRVKFSQGLNARARSKVPFIA